MSTYVTTIDLTWYIVEEEGTNSGLEVVNVAQTLLAELEATKPFAENGGVEVHVEDAERERASSTSLLGKFDNVMALLPSNSGLPAAAVEEDGILISPSRFQPLAEVEEEEMEDQLENEEGLEEGEI
ncbi:hypothetical protein DY000_02041452 [Brassica cretica]|uniref:Uncharacterized protein n=1 Tax=Brassica cretica TaxID=69181 RepID=A0ABQ7BGU7_BRACR|nr:hypothetical protein DY000_02041452 [Brassica cretica]